MVAPSVAAVFVSSCDGRSPAFECHVRRGREAQAGADARLVDANRRRPAARTGRSACAQCVAIARRRPAGASDRTAHRLASDAGAADLDVVRIAVVHDAGAETEENTSAAAPLRRGRARVLRLRLQRSARWPSAGNARSRPFALAQRPAPGSMRDRSRRARLHASGVLSPARRRGGRPTPARARAMRWLSSSPPREMRQRVDRARRNRRAKRGSARDRVRAARSSGCSARWRRAGQRLAVAAGPRRFQCLLVARGIVCADAQRGQRRQHGRQRQRGESRRRVLICAICGSP